MNEIRDLDSAGEVKVDTPSTPSNAPKGSVVGPNHVFEQTVGRVLGIENETDLSHYNEELKDLVDYAKGQVEGEVTGDKISWVIRDLDMRIGASPFAEKRIFKVHRFVKLNKEKQNIDNQLKEFNEYGSA